MYWYFTIYNNLVFNIEEEWKSDNDLFCSRHVHKINELEKSKNQLEYDLRKIVNITKQDTTYINEIISHALDVLNDISLTIEALGPVSENYYDEKNLYIEEDAFDSLFGQKKYLIDKYMKKSSFSDRIDKLEQAQNRIKLLMSSLPKSSQNLSSTAKPVKKPSMVNQRESKGKSFIDRKTNNYTELEKLWQLKDQELEQKIKDLEEKEVIVKKLQIENKKFKLEIEDLNNLVRFIAF